MPALPRASRGVLLAAALGLALAAFEVGEVRGGLAGASALVSLVPVAVAFALAGPKGAAVTTAVALVVVAAAVDGTAAVAVGLRHAVPGLALGVVLTRRLHLPASLIVVGAASLLGLLVLVWAYVPPGLTLLALVGRQIEGHVTELEGLAGRLPTVGDRAWIAESARLVTGILQVAGPAVILVGLLVVALTNYIGARLCLRGRSFRSFAEEAVPDHLVWVVIAAGALLVSHHEAAERLGLNVLLVLAPLYAIQGLAVLRHFFQKARVPRPLQGVSFGLFAVQPLLLVGAACLGLSDLWIDFRKIRQEATPA
ncbi:MAG TPA: DUF2232 domain-containing protein [Methylomirabilota bacterium]|jgi:uncharacterized protein YybS (DUF2232 family)|nr:DUF2232 domain-containing protein [Methylomirabilota bacterium]